MSTNFSAQNSVKPTSTHYGGKIAHSSVLGATVTMLIRGAHTTTDPDANAIGATAASVPTRVWLIRVWACCAMGWCSVWDGGDM